MIRLSNQPALALLESMDVNAMMAALMITALFRFLCVCAGTRLHYIYLWHGNILKCGLRASFVLSVKGTWHYGSSGSHLKKRLTGICQENRRHLRQGWSVRSLFFMQFKSYPRKILSGNLRLHVCIMSRWTDYSLSMIDFGQFDPKWWDGRLQEALDDGNDSV